MIIASIDRRSIVRNFREYYQECFEPEKPKFIRVIKAVPSDQAGYRPHPRSTCAGDLVWLLAGELRDACEIVDRGEVSYVVRPAPTVPESVAAYQRNAEDLERRVATLDDAHWDRRARFLVDTKIAWETSLGDTSLGFSSTRSITAGSFRATCVRWAPKFRRSAVPRRTIQGCDCDADQSFPIKRISN
jgi:hypothetical protein